MGTDAANRAKVRRMFDEHYDAISRYCHRRLPAADANDAAAAVFAVAWRKIDTVPSGEQALHWLYAVARNEVIRHCPQRGHEGQEKPRSQGRPGTQAQRSGPRSGTES